MFRGLKNEVPFSTSNRWFSRLCHLQTLWSDICGFTVFLYVFDQNQIVSFAEYLEQLNSAKQEAGNAKPLSDPSPIGVLSAVLRVEKREGYNCASGAA